MQYRTQPPTFVPPPTLFLGSFPPRECGIATFTKDVVDSFDEAFHTHSDVIAIDEPGGEARAYDAQVIGRIVQDDRSSYRRAAALANAQAAQLVNVQHEYGLFGGEEGAWFLDFLEELEKPVAVSLHTVLPNPERAHRAIARRVCERADSVVVLSQTGKNILRDVYGVDERKISVIHHGVPDVPFRSTDAKKIMIGIDDRMLISTFGLISRGKGLEYAIDAMKIVVARHPEVLYVILGQTHPGVRRHEGESYRESIREKIAEAGLEKHVRLVDRYLAFEELVDYLSATDIYLTPYLNPAQIVSGTLAYAVGCGKAIVSTPYLYAKEVLAHGRGLFADFRDADGLATQILTLLDDPWLRWAMQRRAYRYGRQMTWPNVAIEYGKLFADLVPQRSVLPALVLPA